MSILQGIFGKFFIDDFLIHTVIYRRKIIDALFYLRMTCYFFTITKFIGQRQLWGSWRTRCLLRRHLHGQCRLTQHWCTRIIFWAESIGCTELGGRRFYRCANSSEDIKVSLWSRRCEGSESHDGGGYSGKFDVFVEKKMHSIKNWSCLFATGVFICFPNALKVRNFSLRQDNLYNTIGKD